MPEAEPDRNTNPQPDKGYTRADAFLAYVDQALAGVGSDPEHSTDDPEAAPGEAD